MSFANEMLSCRCNASNGNAMRLAARSLLSILADTSRPSRATSCCSRASRAVTTNVQRRALRSFPQGEEHAFKRNFWRDINGKRCMSTRPVWTDNDKQALMASLGGMRETELKKQMVYYKGEGPGQFHSPKTFGRMVEALATHLLSGAPKTYKKVSVPIPALHSLLYDYSLETLRELARFLNLETNDERRMTYVTAIHERVRKAQVGSQSQPFKLNDITAAELTHLAIKDLMPIVESLGLEISKRKSATIRSILSYIELNRTDLHVRATVEMIARLSRPNIFSAEIPITPDGRIGGRCRRPSTVVSKKAAQILCLDKPVHALGASWDGASPAVLQWKELLDKRDDDTLAKGARLIPKQDLLRLALGYGLQPGPVESAVQVFRRICQHVVKGEPRSPNIRLSKLPLPELQEKARSFGLTPSGTREVLLKRLQDHLTYVRNAPTPSSIVAIDVGPSNTGYVHLALPNTLPSNIKDRDKGATDEVLSRPRILDWALLDLEVSSMDFPGVAMACKQLLDERCYKPEAQVYLVERQTWRVVFGKLTVPPQLIASLVTEAVLLGMLLERRGEPATSVLPAYVSRHFSLNDPASIQTSDVKKRQPRSKRAKKITAVHVVKKILEDQDVDCSKELLHVFNTTKKKDDMSDALLMALAWRDWWFAAKAEAAAQLEIDSQEQAVAEEGEMAEERMMA
ncbi:uncharacterized protein SPPG_00786, partial [Spizellomyces punctatus DAOM BR117]